MPFPNVRIPRSSLPALVVTALFHALVIAMLIVAMPKRFERQPAVTGEAITYLPLLAPLPEKKKRSPRGSTGSRPAVTYFNPDTVETLPALRPNLSGLQTALSACAPENYDMASVEIRAVCTKIGALLTYDKGHFGVTQDVADPKHWQAELARREAPYLAPCMSSAGFSPLYTLLCIYDTLMHGYDPKKMDSYAK